ncbi:hypothetical protein [Roseovarius atlanticus]|uniref:hypothetical protein n=1 Tax=Roseovarius atlanticus TaxID=1641875 RepID=UPI001C95A363|nr:hypothetical protein [Roseovarius atlanticus]MBY5989991.1 hypothetical protein [Roseovarius atlanticus]MBY6126536.1 hypothetical protein [Roseovarius atlanticus]MBY6151030.1 hypothetical protein [Roseovarius atlanticus]
MNQEWTYAYRATALVASAALVLGVSACRDENEDARAGSGTTLPSNSARVQDVIETRNNWLDPGERESPAAFLARQTDGDYDMIVARLPVVEQHFRETPRMVANRLVQLWETSRDADPTPSLEEILDELGKGSSAAPRVFLGPLVQQYRVMIEEGVPHGPALAAARREGR